MNKKGFTLVEVIVCMAIFAVLAALSYPTISNIVIKHRTQQYEEYEKLMVSAAKLYFEEKSGTIVSLDTLMNEKLIGPPPVVQEREVLVQDSQVQIISMPESYGKKTVYFPKLVFDNGECCYSTVVSGSPVNSCKNVCA